MRYISSEEFDLMTEAEIDAWEEEKLMQELDNKAKMIREKNKIVPLPPFHRKLAAMVSQTANKNN